jgi:hypothetical protein
MSPPDFPILCASVVLTALRRTARSPIGTFPLASHDRPGRWKGRSYTPVLPGEPETGARELLLLPAELPSRRRFQHELAGRPAACHRPARRGKPGLPSSVTKMPSYRGGLSARNSGPRRSSRKRSSSRPIARCCWFSLVRPGPRGGRARILVPQDGKPGTRRTALCPRARPRGSAAAAEVLILHSCRPNGTHAVPPRPGSSSGPAYVDHPEQRMARVGRARSSNRSAQAPLAAHVPSRERSASSGPSGTPGHDRSSRAGAAEGARSHFGDVASRSLEDPAAPRLSARWSGEAPCPICFSAFSRCHP